jgi:hypothetical protein
MVMLVSDNFGVKMSTAIKISEELVAFSKPYAAATQRSANMLKKIRISRLV